MRGAFDIPGATRLHLGCGKVFAPPPWINVDWGAKPQPGHHVLEYDLTSFPWPRASSSVECVYAEHVLEHFDEVDGMRFLAEVYRVLEPGGIVRLSMPDLDQMIDRYVRRHASPTFAIVAQRHGTDDPVAMLNRSFFGTAVGGVKFLSGYTSFGQWADGHRFLYNYDNLHEKLGYLGFTDIVRAPYGEPSDDRMLAESRPPVSDLVVEARRPAGR